MRVASCGSCEVTRAIGVMPHPERRDADRRRRLERGRVVLEVDVDRVEAAGGGDHRDVRRAHLVDPHAQHQLVRLQHPLDAIFADLRRHGRILPVGWIGLG